MVTEEKLTPDALAALRTLLEKALSDSHADLTDQSCAGCSDWSVIVCAACDTTLMCAPPQTVLALLAAAEAQTWQSMETAPKDGTWILALVPRCSFRRRWQVRWIEMRQAPQGVVIYCLRRPSPRRGRRNR